MRCWQFSELGSERNGEGGTELGKEKGRHDELDPDFAIELDRSIKGLLDVG